jgi:hypothetical protein
LSFDAKLFDDLDFMAFQVTFFHTKQLSVELPDTFMRVSIFYNFGVLDIIGFRVGAGSISGFCEGLLAATTGFLTTGATAFGGTTSGFLISTLGGAGICGGGITATTVFGGRGSTGVPILSDHPALYNPVVEIATSQSGSFRSCRTSRAVIRRIIRPSII